MRHRGHAGRASSDREGERSSVKLRALLSADSSRTRFRLASLGAVLLLLGAVPLLRGAARSAANRRARHDSDRGSWIREGVFARPYPRRAADLGDLAERGVTVIVNLDRRPHDPSLLARYGLTEVHLPVADFTAPPPDVLDRGVAAIVTARANGNGVCVHCAGGLGRTGTLLACYLIRSEGLSAPAAIAEIRRRRPGSVETRSQVAAIERYERRLRPHRT